MKTVKVLCLGELPVKVRFMFLAERKRSGIYIPSIRYVYEKVGFRDGEVGDTVIVTGSGNQTIPVLDVTTREISLWPERRLVIPLDNNVLE